MTKYSEMNDEQLDDMGMYRCVCAVVVYPTGDPAPHCDLEVARQAATLKQSV